MHCFCLLDLFAACLGAELTECFKGHGRDTVSQTLSPETPESICHCCLCVWELRVHKDPFQCGEPDSWASPCFYLFSNYFKLKDCNHFGESNFNFELIFQALNKVLSVTRKLHPPPERSLALCPSVSSH